MDKTLEETAEQKRQQADELVQLVMGVALMAFAIIAVAVLITMRVTDVMGHPY